MQIEVKQKSWVRQKPKRGEKVNIRKRKRDASLIVLTVPVDKRLDQLATIQFVVVVWIVHFEVVELQFRLRHFARIDGNLHVLLNVTVGDIQQNINKWAKCQRERDKITCVVWYEKPLIGPMSFLINGDW